MVNNLYVSFVFKAESGVGYHFYLFLSLLFPYFFFYFLSRLLFCCFSFVYHSIEFLIVSSFNFYFSCRERTLFTFRISPDTHTLEENEHLELFPYR